MKADELDAINLDVTAAVVESGSEDPTLLPELITYLLDQIGKVATAPHEAFPGSWALTAFAVQADLEDWADAILRTAQIRAVSKIPFNIPTHDDEPEDHR